MIFPATILKPPFLYSNGPAAINYGAIGWLIGHELTHGFDDWGQFGLQFTICNISIGYYILGVKYDSNGNLKNRFTEEATERFDEKANCFVKQYSSEYVPEVHMNLNGRNTLGENIADNGGLRESFRAFQTYVKTYGEPQRLPYPPDCPNIGHPPTVFSISMRGVTPLALRFLLNDILIAWETLSSSILKLLYHILSSGNVWDASQPPHANA
ncbi:unnamed protein product [Oppiella nova]|uniref:Peptidase M13 C-terminal domain-containing protein n=1 Tax=Oppiella nova TaxID=334625 RepID=A0A7R9M937_9ACAR|nr:unnamed protein product [Oppiella nova]CAG2173089.1 unnamed protein product [Oppiella nova]